MYDIYLSLYGVPEAILLVCVVDIIYTTSSASSDIRYPSPNARVSVIRAMASGHLGIDRVIDLKVYPSSSHVMGACACLRDTT